ncbi:hypothetical protein [Kribbella sp. NPDC049227]|uniref:hypothetical protein n=1 Tax=Kribbella sp. NPDC049227 TaxID=3364113 RepID=UPI00371BF43E
MILRTSPETLAGGYLGHRESSRVEWLRFTNRFAAAVFVHRTVAAAVPERGEFEDESVRIAARAAIGAATAALERFMNETVGALTGGLAQQVELLLAATECSRAQRVEIVELRARVVSRRTAVTHSTEKLDLSADGIEQALRDVGALALMLGALVEPDEQQRVTDLMTGWFVDL